MKKPWIEWDEAKNAINQRKHGISFDEASTVFADEHALLPVDPDRSNDEDRFILLSFSASLRILVVCHCYGRGEDIIRIISARRARRLERAAYSERWRK